MLRSGGRLDALRPHRAVVDYRGRAIVLADRRARDEAVARFATAAPLSAGLPLKLAGGFELTELQIQCDRCAEVCTESRGEVNLLYPHIIVIDGLGLCKPCSFLTAVRMRLQHRKDEQPTMTWLSHGEWQHKPLEQMVETWFDRVTARLARLAWRWASGFTRTR